MNAGRTLPIPDIDSEPFWQACREGHLAMQRCPACTKFRWPPMRFCPHCHQDGGEWTSLPGTGEIRSFVIAERAFDPAFEDRVPYVVAHVTLDGADELAMIGNVLADSADAVSIGQRVAVSFVEEGSMMLPQFRPI